MYCGFVPVYETLKSCNSVNIDLPNLIPSYSDFPAQIGFLFLPFVWAVNSCWFFSEAFRKPPFDEQQQIKRYVIWSAVGTLIWAAIIAAWVAVFQVNRATWGAFADEISFIIPLGRA